jgi:two-component system, chemotaxis family, protein-glutamate methylesterase/glutaminase
MNKIRVMIVEDSLVIREFLRYIIGRDSRLEVTAAVGSAEEALRILHQVSPDVISMDIRLPGMNGFEATQRIMAEKPTPIVVVSASVESEDLKVSMNALRAGALAVVEKPVGTRHASYEALADRLCTQLVIMSRVKVIRQRLGLGLPLGVSEAPRSLRDQPLRAPGPLCLMGIVASTGGPDALVKVLGGLSPRFPLPILLVQHITASFLKGFVAWLDDLCPLSVTVAREWQVPEPGKVYVAPEDRHLVIEQGSLRLEGGPSVCAQRPSGTVLFRSMARDLGPRALAVLLTGMGEDGAEGMRNVRAAGGYTIAEDESTAVVYGMPAAAVRFNAVCESLPLPEIAPRLRELVSTTREVP